MTIIISSGKIILLQCQTPATDGITDGIADGENYDHRVTWNKLRVTLTPKKLTPGTDDENYITELPETSEELP